METREGGHVRDDKFDSIDTEENGGQATLLCRKISDVSLCCLSCCCRVAAHIANITIQTISPIANLHVKVWQITQRLRFYSFLQFSESTPINNFRNLILLKVRRLLYFVSTIHIGTSKYNWLNTLFVDKQIISVSRHLIHILYIINFTSDLTLPGVSTRISLVKSKQTSQFILDR